jgi:hypothetical protein
LEGGVLNSLVRIITSVQAGLLLGKIYLTRTSTKRYITTYREYTYTCKPFYAISSADLFTVSVMISLLQAYVRNFADKDGKVWQGGGGRNPPPEAPHLVVTTPEIESLRPKSPPAKN